MTASSCASHGAGTSTPPGPSRQHRADRRVQVRRLNDVPVATAFERSFLERESARSTVPQKPTVRWRSVGSVSLCRARCWRRLVLRSDNRCWRPLFQSQVIDSLTAGSCSVHLWASSPLGSLSPLLAAAVAMGTGRVSNAAVSRSPWPLRCWRSMFGSSCFVGPALSCGCRGSDSILRQCCVTVVP